jgi:hypothetical protein
VLPAPVTRPAMVDVIRLGHQSVTSFYSNLVTRPTGRAVRMGVESQIAELGVERQPCLSILDFSQVRVIDYSCADEIVAKLLLRYAGDPRPGEVFFLIRGLQEHQQDAVEAVLERHELLAVLQDEGRGFVLLGPADPFQRSLWSAILPRPRARPAELAAELQLPDDVVQGTVRSLVLKRVAFAHHDGCVSGLPALLAV